MEKIVFKGTVFSGTGEGRRFIDLPWVKWQIEGKLGFSPFSGTLNLHILEGSLTQTRLLCKVSGIPIHPEKGYFPGILIRACVGSLEGAIVIPQVPNYPQDVFELIAPVNLREWLKLDDGSEVTVTVKV